MAIPHINRPLGRMPKIAILGWGSLLWDKRPGFDEQHGEWLPEGPELAIEFSRVSRKSRGGALTLVIDKTSGSICSVSYTFSLREDPEDAICDLKSREGTVRKHIGYFIPDGVHTQCQDADTLEGIEGWAKLKAVDAVVWTDLRSNFEDEVHKPFSVTNALNYLRSLPEDVKTGAATYMWQAPDFVKTPLRTAVEIEPWFQLTTSKLSEGSGSQG